MWTGTGTIKGFILGKTGAYRKAAGNIRFGIMAAGSWNNRLQFATVL